MFYVAKKLFLRQWFPLFSSIAKYTGNVILLIEMWSYFIAMNKENFLQLVYETRDEISANLVTRHIARLITQHKILPDRSHSRSQKKYHPGPPRSASTLYSFHAIYSRIYPRGILFFDQRRHIDDERSGLTAVRLKIGGRGGRSKKSDRVYEVARSSE